MLTHTNTLIHTHTWVVGHVRIMHTCAHVNAVAHPGGGADAAYNVTVFAGHDCSKVFLGVKQQVIVSSHYNG